MSPSYPTQAEAEAAMVLYPDFPAPSDSIENHVWAEKEIGYVWMPWHAQITRRFRRSESARHPGPILPVPDQCTGHTGQLNQRIHRHAKASCQCLCLAQVQLAFARQHIRHHALSPHLWQARSFRLPRICARASFLSTSTRHPPRLSIGVWRTGGCSGEADLSALSATRRSSSMSPAHGNGITHGGHAC